jgi:hypothetical protein
LCGGGAFEPAACGFEHDGAAVAAGLAVGVAHDTARFQSGIKASTMERVPSCGMGEQQ